MWASSVKISSISAVYILQEEGNIKRVTPGSYDNTDKFKSTLAIDVISPIWF